MVKQTFTNSRIHLSINVQYSFYRQSSDNIMTVTVYQTWPDMPQEVENSVEITKLNF